MKYINKNEFEKLNIIKWHELGYTGKGIKIANLEECNTQSWNLKSKINNPHNMHRNGTNNHGDIVVDILLQVAPDSEITILDNSNRSVVGGGIEGAFIDKSLPYIDKHGIHLVNASLEGSSSEALADRVKQSKDNGTTFISAAGNSSKYGTMGYNSSTGWISISSSYLSKNGDVSILNNSARGEDIDFTCFGNILANNQKDKNYPIRVTGTSFASPFFCGMLALVQQFFLEKTGKSLHPDKLLQFVKDNTLDLGEKGRDNLYGNGLFILPNPEDINVEEYIKIEKEDDIMSEFSDVKEDRWSVDDIELVSNLKLMEGYPDGSFKPTKEVTREELATVTANLIRLFNNK